jgi:hypothetical protein
MEKEELRLDGHKRFVSPVVTQYLGTERQRGFGPLYLRFHLAAGGEMVLPMTDEASRALCSSLCDMGLMVS